MWLSHCDVDYIYDNKLKYILVVSRLVVKPFKAIIRFSPMPIHFMNDLTDQRKRISINSFFFIDMIQTYVNLWFSREIWLSHYNNFHHLQIND